MGAREIAIFSDKIAATCATIFPDLIGEACPPSTTSGKVLMKYAAPARKVRVYMDRRPPRLTPQSINFETPSRPPYCQCSESGRRRPRFDRRRP